MGYHYGKFAWFEHVSNDLGKARQFYEQLFGWKVKSFAPGAYEVIHNGDEFIGGMVAAEPGLRAHWRSWLSVPDVDESYRAAMGAGAQTVAAPHDYPGIGRGAILHDPGGARLAIWKGATGDRPDVDTVKTGDFDWNELSTPDPAKALAFYESVFGYTHEDWDLGEAGMYHVIKDASGRARGGVMKAHEGAPAAWVPYVKVEGADETASRVGPLGGDLLVKPMDVKEVGRIAILSDPFAAPLGFIQPAVKA